VSSSRPLRNNYSYINSTNDVFCAPSYNVDEASNHEPIDVDSLGSPPTNIDPSKGEANSSARQI